MDLKKKGFHLPENIYFDSESLTDSYGRLYAEPFERGFGTTLGNALRRVLLSSIEGAAVTAIRIPGVLHEFSTLPGVKEDVMDIVLNIKLLRFRMHTDTSKVVSIDVKGPGEVRGKDITSDAQVEVLTPDQYIATLDKNASFKMELTVKKGRGYVPAERNKEEGQAIDILSIDSIFTPIKKVNFWIESARVGRSTDYDKLIMEIWTDGSITPKQAVTQAADILQGHIALFRLEEEPEKEEEPPVAVATGDSDPQKEPIEFNENLLKSVDELELSVRSYNCLKNANIRTIADLVQKSEQEILRTKNFGRKSLNEIKEIIHKMGLRFNMNIDMEKLQSMAAKRVKTDAS